VRSEVINNGPPRHSRSKGSRHRSRPPQKNHAIRKKSEAIGSWREHGKGKRCVPSASKGSMYQKRGAAVSRVEYTLTCQRTWGTTCRSTPRFADVVPVTPSEIGTDDWLGRGLLIAEGDGVGTRRLRCARISSVFRPFHLLVDWSSVG
jgi:hypothetical protein